MGWGVGWCLSLSSSLLVTWKFKHISQDSFQVDCLQKAFPGLTTSHSQHLCSSADPHLYFAVLVPLFA